MKDYIGTKFIKAEPMQKDSVDGYKVEYEDGYISWSPKDVFEKAYKSDCNLTFGMAIELMKKGWKVAREGWNGKGMWLMLMLTPPTESIHVDGKVYGFLSYIQMKTVDDKMVPWLASQTDILSNDWVIVE